METVYYVLQAILSESISALIKTKHNFFRQPNVGLCVAYVNLLVASVQTK